jgi:hypothetical protein
LFYLLKNLKEQQINHFDLLLYLHLILFYNH